MRKEYATIFILVLAVTGYIYLSTFREQENNTPPRYDNIDDILAACAEAMGGTDVISGIQTLRLTMNWPDHGVLYTEIRRPNMVRLGESLIWNGSYSVLLNSPDPVPEEEWKDNEADIAWYFPAFFDYPTEYLGAQTVEGVVSYKVEVTLPLGAVMTYYIDSETDLVHKITADIVLYGEAHHSERVYSDYESVDGFAFPHSFTYAGRDGVSRLTATIENLELNLPLEGRFTIP
jgi:hypothetical protein